MIIFLRGHGAMEQDASSPDGDWAVARRGLEIPSKEKMAFPFPDKPSIAVLPFANMSSDPQQAIPLFEEAIPLLYLLYAGLY